MPKPLSKEAVAAIQMDRLKTNIADESAMSDIECLTEVHEDKKETWYDTASVTDEDKRWITQAVSYLELRGLLLHHPKNPKWVRCAIEPSRMGYLA